MYITYLITLTNSFTRNPQISKYQYSNPLHPKQQKRPSKHTNPHYRFTALLRYTASPPPQHPTVAIPHNSGPSKTFEPLERKGRGRRQSLANGLSVAGFLPVEKHLADAHRRFSLCSYPQICSMERQCARPVVNLFEWTTTGPGRRAQWPALAVTGINQFREKRLEGGTLRWERGFPSSRARFDTPCNPYPPSFAPPSHRGKIRFTVGRVRDASFC